MTGEETKCSPKEKGIVLRVVLSRPCARKTRKNGARSFCGEFEVRCVSRKGVAAL